MSTVPVTYIAVDNGVSGAWGFVADDGFQAFFQTPVKKELNYTKEKKFVNRLDVQELMKQIREVLGPRVDNTKVVMERPMVNPTRFQASASALRAYEATLIALELLGLPVTEVVDSRKWQSEMLPDGCTGDDLKVASKDIGIRKFPKFHELIKKQKDADALLMAEWARHNKL